MATSTESPFPATNVFLTAIRDEVVPPALGRTAIPRLLRYPALLLAAVCLLCGFSSVQAQTLDNIPALSFTKAYESADPLPQVINLASTGAAFRFTVNATTFTGGSWLSITNSGGYNYPTPTAVTVTANPAATLAAGTYSGQIIATPTSGGTALTIPVSLTVAAKSVTFFDDLPGALTFSMLTKGSSPPAQPLLIRNAGAGTLGFTAASSTSDGGNWLKLSATTGTAPSLISVTVVPASLPGGGLSAGTFTGQVLLKTGTDTVSIPVTVTVGDSVFRQNNALNFTKLYEGADPLPQVITFASTGASFRFVVKAVNSTGGDWLSITNSGGYNYPMPTDVTVSVRPAVTLAAGTYTAEIIALSTDGTQSQVIPVTLNVESPSATFFDELPGQLTFSMLTKGSAPPPQPVQIRNGGAGTLSFTAATTTADGGSWLTLSAISGTAPVTLSVGINPANLPGGGLSPGTFTGELLLKSGTDTTSLPITVTVGDSVFRQVNALDFTKAYKGPNPLPQVITFSSTGSPFRFVVNAVNSTGGSWLSISNSGGYNYATPTAVTVTATPDPTLTAGTYSAEIIALSTDGTQSQVIPVTLTVSSPGSAFLDDLPGQLTFSMVTRGAAPSAQLVPIRNAGAGPLSFNATTTTADGASWIILSESNGTAPNLLSVGVNPANLPGGGLSAGTFTGQVLLKTGTDTATLPITVTVGDSVFLQLNQLSFTMPAQGADPLPQVITFASTGSSFRFVVNAINSTGGNWLSISNSGGYNYSTPTAVTVTVHPVPALASGTYSAEIIAISTDGTQSQVIPVTLTVEPPTAAFFNTLPGALTFSGPANGATPPTLPLPIRNAGPGILNWVATPITADHGSWLKLSATSGIAPATPTVTIIPGSLPGKGLVAGTFTGQILLQSASGISTIPVTVTLGNPAFTQLAPLSFTKNYQATNPTAQTITINSNGASIRFVVNAISATGGNWLTITNSGGYNYPTPTAVTVSVNPDVNLAPGVYTASIYGTDTVGDEPLVIPVTLTVNSASATAAPTFTPPGGSYSTAQTVSLVSKTIDVALYYTLDGSAPTTASARYTTPLAVTATETIRAIAIAPGFPQSAIASATYTMTSPQAATPAITQTITIAEATASVTVYYTTTGTTPTAASTKYTGPITLSSSSTLKFIAIGPNYQSSSVRTISTNLQ